MQNSVQSVSKETAPDTDRPPRDDVGDRIAAGLERIAAVLEAMQAITPSRLDRLTESLYAAILINSGQAETPLHARELATRLAGIMQGMAGEGPEGGRVGG